MPQTLNQLSTLPFDNNIILNALNKDDKSAAVYDFSGGYNVIDFLITRNAPARRVDGLDGVFQKPIMGRSDIGVQIASNSASGNNLVVNFSDPTFQAFRLTEVIADGTATMNQGRVISVAPGTVTLEPVSGNSSLSTSTFVAGSFASRMFQASVNRGSTGITSLYEDPTYVRNQTSITRESLTVYRRDFMKTWVEFSGDYWISAQEPITMKRFARGLERKAIWGRYGTSTSVSLGGGTVNYSMGLKDSIQDAQRGGVYQALTGAMTQAQFESWIGRIADRKNSSKYKVTIGCGRGFLRWIQSFTTPFIQFAGNRNTFGGDSVKGIDTYVFSVNGIEVELIMIPLFNDRDQFPALSTISGLGQFTRMQYTAIAFDTDMYESVGGGAMLPAMEKTYFGNEEIIYGYIPGMIGSNLGGSNTLKTGNVLAVTDKDAVSMEIYSDCAYDFMSYRMGWLELVS